MADNTHDILRSLVAKLRCKPGWSFRLKDEDGALRFVVRVVGLDSSLMTRPVNCTRDGVELC